MAKPPNKRRSGTRSRTAASAARRRHGHRPDTRIKGLQVLVTIRIPKSSHALVPNITIGSAWPMAGAGLRRKSHRSVGQTDADPDGGQTGFLNRPQRPAKGITMFEFSRMRIMPPRFAPAFAALLPAAATEPAGSVPDFSSNGVSWAGFVAPKTPSAAIAVPSRLFAPASGLGPVTDDPAILYQQRAGARDNRQPTYRVADLNNPNLKPLGLWRR